MAEFVATSSTKSRGTWLVVLIVIVFLILGFMAYTFMTNRSPKSDTQTTPYIETEQASAPRRAQPHDAGNYPFDDGLKNPGSTTEYKLDEFGAGIASRDMWNIDINNDGLRDRITRDHIENGTDHYYDEYKIELNTSAGFIDITPAGFRTVEGADCALQKLRFTLAPSFQVTKISREWSETWDTPTPAVRTVYKLVGDELQTISSRQLRTICNVSDLF